MALIEKFVYSGIEIRKTEINGEYDFWKKEEGISYPLSEKQYTTLKSRNVVSKTKIKEVMSLERGLSYYSRYNGDDVAEAIKLGIATLFDNSETKREKIDIIYNNMYDLLKDVRYQHNLDFNV